MAQRAFCVNRKSKEFKDKAEQFNLAPEVLEKVAYEYGNRQETYGEFPSDDYIQKRLFTRDNEVGSQGQIALWEREFKGERTFNTLKEAQDYIESALQFFSEDAVAMHEQADGTFYANVAEAHLQRSQELVDRSQESKDKKGKKLKGKESRELNVSEIEDKLKDTTKWIGFDYATHTYFPLDAQGRRGEPFDTSVTSFYEEVIKGKLKKEINPQWGIPSQNRGNTMDELVRDFFKGGVRAHYPNLTDDQVKEEVKKLEEFRDKTLPSLVDTNDFTVITNDVYLAGTLTYKGERKTVAGSPDMVILTKNGYYIIDVKNKRRDLAQQQGSIDNYTMQVTLYSMLMEETYPELKGKFLGASFLTFTDEYPDPRKSNEEDPYSSTITGIHHFDETGKVQQVYYEGNPIQDVVIEPQIHTDDEGNVATVPINKEVRQELIDDEDLRIQGYNPSQIATEQERNNEDGKSYEEIKKERNQEAVSSLTDKEREYLEDSNFITAQFDNLYNSPDITSSTLLGYAQDLANWLSDFITGLQKGNSETKGLLQEQYRSIDFGSMSRVEIIGSLGLNSILNLAKDTLFSEANVKSWDALDGLIVIRDNWEAFIQIAAEAIGENENISVKTRKITETQIESPTAEDLQQDEQELTDNNVEEVTPQSDMETQELEGNSQEHWQVEFRTVSAVKSLSQRAREVLRSFHVKDANGNDVRNEIGVIQRYKDSDIIKKCLHILNGSTSLEAMEGEDTINPEWLPSSMLGKLKAYAETTTESWVQDLMGTLDTRKIQEQFASGEITASEMADRYNFQSEFYSVMMRHFQSYTVISRNRDGNLIIIDANSSPAMRDVLTEIIAAYNDGEHPLFDDNAKEGIRALEDDHHYNPTTKKGYWKEGLLKEVRVLARKGKFTEEDENELVQKMSEILTLCGATINEDIIRQVVRSDKDKIIKVCDSVSNMLSQIRKGNKAETFNPFDPNDENRITGDLRKILRPFTALMDSSDLDCVYNDSKTYQSYVTPNYLSTLMLKFQETDEDAFKDFIKQEYCQSEWFKDADDNWNEGFRFAWLQYLAKADAQTRQKFRHVVVLNQENKQYMRDMLAPDYAMMMLSMYFSEKPTRGNTWAYYRVPIMSNKASAEFIRFRRFTEEDNFKETITEGMRDVALAEIMRIRTVLARKKAGTVQIQNLDKHGDKFLFFDSILNQYLNNDKTGSKQQRLVDEEFDELHRLLKTVTEEGFEEDDTESQRRLEELLDKAIRKGMDYKVAEMADQLNNSGITTLFGSLGNINTTVRDSEIDIESEDTDEISQRRAEIKQEKINKYLEEFLWNDTFAAINILAMTTTDPAYFKDAVDMQKRLAELHSPAIRGNVDARDPRGNGVCDGKMRNVVLTDFDGVISNVKENVSYVLKNKIAEAEQKVSRGEMTKEDFNAYKDFVNSIIDSFDDINVADAQAYTSPSAYRKKAIMFGKWSEEAEDAYQNLLKGVFDYTTLKQAFQPLKPFVYSQYNQPSGVNGPIQTFKVSVQNKNAEYLLVMADAILRGEKTEKPNLLRAIFDVMEESAGLVYNEDTNEWSNTEIQKGLNESKITPNDHGIDVIQFDSAVKTGAKGKIDSKSLNQAKSVDEAREILRAAIYKGDEYNQDYVTEIDAHDYGIQQENPAHFNGHEQPQGSQERVLVCSELPNVDAEGNEVKYVVETDDNEGNIEEEEMSASQIRQEYEHLQSDNIEESFQQLANELFGEDKELEGLSEEAKRLKRNIKLSRLLEKQIQNNIQRYGVDMLQAVKLQDGEFVLPLSDPMMRTRIQMLLNSAIKNHIHQQKVAGGPVVQVTSFGLSKNLNIRFKDKNGNLLKTLDDWLKSGKSKEEYAEYIKNNQAGVAHMEIYAPAFMKSLLKNFVDANGNINTEAIEQTCPEILTMIGYRIPTEAKYSIFPMRIVGFLPREAGEALMMPYEVTLLTGSDFDVDKMYLMRKEITIKERKDEDVNNILMDIAKSLKRKRGIETDNSNTTNAELLGYIRQVIDSWANDELKNATEEQSEIVREYQKRAFYAVKPTEGRAWRNNRLLDLQLAMLTNAAVADQLLTPQNFDQEKKIGHAVKAVKMGIYTDINEALQQDVKTLADQVNNADNLIYFTSQLSFYEQNQSGAQLLGIMAVQRTAHAVFAGDRFVLDGGDILGEDALKFDIGGKIVDLSDDIELDPVTDIKGNLVGSTLGHMVGASADTAKDPFLSLNNITSQTADLLTTMLRVGIPYKQAALLLSCKGMDSILEEFKIASASKSVTISSLIDKKLADMEDALNTKMGEKGTEPVTEEDLEKGINSDDSVLQWKLLNALRKVSTISEYVRNFSEPAKLNSLIHSVGPTEIDNKQAIIKYDDFPAEVKMLDEEGRVITDEDGDEMGGLQAVFKKHPMLGSFYKMYAMADALSEGMPEATEEYDEYWDYLNEATEDRMNWDKKFATAATNYFLSSLAIQGGLVDINDLDYYINDFPKKFLSNAKNSVKKGKYKDNALIKAINIKQERKSIRYYLDVRTLGLENTEIDALKAAWYDLYKQEEAAGKKDKDNLAIQLLTYNVFRGGIGFSPKSFMKLANTNLKKAWKNGNVRYTSLYNDIIVESDAADIADQFIRSNTDDRRLVPPIKYIKSDFTITNGTWFVNEKNIDKYSGYQYFKITLMEKGKPKQTLIMRRMKTGENVVAFKPVTPLGGTGDYFEYYTDSDYTCQQIKDQERGMYITPKAIAIEKNRLKRIVKTNDKLKVLSEDKQSAWIEDKLEENFGPAYTKRKEEWAKKQQKRRKNETKVEKTATGQSISSAEQRKSMSERAQRDNLLADFSDAYIGGDASKFVGFRGELTKQALKKEVEKAGLKMSDSELNEVLKQLKDFCK